MKKGITVVPFPHCPTCDVLLKDRRSRTCTKCIDWKVTIAKRPPASAEHRKNISNALKGRVFTPEWREKISQSGKGKHSISDELRIKLTEGSKKRRGIMPKNLSSLHGANHWCWKGGITPEHRMIRASAKYRDWRKAVFERDDYTCQKCGIRGGILNADHIKLFSAFPELRFELSNGRTLCVGCHRKTETWGINGKRKKALLASLR